MVQTLHTQSSVEAVLTPIGLNTINYSIINMEKPDLFKIHKFLLIDNAEEVGRLGSLNRNLCYSGVVIADEETSHPH